MRSNFAQLRNRVGALIAAAFMLPGQAPAHSLTTAVGTLNWTFGGAAQVIVPNTTTAFFAKPANQRLIITYAAECAVNAAAGNTSGWMDVDIVLLNIAGAVVYTAPPTVGSADAYCAANGSAGFDGWESNAVVASVPFNFPAGVYRAQVRARLNGGATGGWFGERQLVVSL
jgi:hypothetical protein